MWYPICKYGIDEYTKDIKKHQKTSMATTSAVGVTYPSFAGVLCLVVAPPTVEGVFSNLHYGNV